MRAQPACRQPLRDPFDDLGADLRVEPAAGEIVEEEQWLRPLDHEVVDRHRDEVDADRGVPAGIGRDLRLGADAVRRRHQDRVLETGTAEVEGAAKAADFGIGAGAGGGAYQRFDELDHAVAGVDIDAGLRVGETGAACLGHFRDPSDLLAEDGAWYGENVAGATASRTG